MGAGTIADIFESHERGRVFAYYTLGPLLGPAFGPIIGGYLNQGLGWRSNFWFLAIFALCIWIAIFFLLPETSRSFPTQEPREKQGAQYIERKAKIRTINPLRALRLLLYPNIALVVAYVGVLFFFQYLNSAVFTRVYTNQYGLDSGIVGVCYLPYAVGAMIGGNIGGRISDKVYNKRVAKAKEKEEDIYPEMRLSGLVLGCASIIQLLSLVAYGWCVQKEVHFAYGLVCQFLYGSAFMLPNVTATAYMVDSFRKDGASATDMLWQELGL
ncbi:hypothetical protein G6F46_005739 [Rhizopus delemar]|uniref:Major facilitator superfamily (MFS) profile domain-containing protein n=2 Tax=Rhizopus TaxID=4842 RepID=A0A9P7CP40_9FUNG|nr:hypothetical protein G6F55_004488 [Rhizopus delemar]KAG1544391.1 hypothetical protein G6F51_006086 [Rhizopus arrhizus]KAG1498121.1 hypothetical protein G6F54_005302 [Rhizopus delemar]KAG1511885.1 hypothetical protein G6F53_005598 [Rhizopus delemar]KAG1526993.1 hypothetical protein G6F52_001940 [Rhizopus delemar]